MNQKVYIVVEWVDLGCYILGVYANKEHAESVQSNLVKQYNAKYARFSKHAANNPYDIIIEQVITTKGTIQ
jgi:hypothetical protein